MRNALIAASFTATLSWRHLRKEPARQPLLALRLMPSWARRGLVAASRPLGGLAHAYALWGAGQRERCVGVVRRAAHGAPSRRLAALADFATAAELLDLAEELLARLPDDPRHARRRRRLAVKTGRLVPGSGPDDLDGQRVSPEASLVPPKRTARSPAMNTRAAKVNNRVLHFVTNALPHTNAGYTQRTHRIALGQREAGLDPHIVTRLGYPLAQGVLDARPLVAVDDVPYHRLLPWTAPRDPEAALRGGLRLGTRLVERLRPAVLHAASNYANAEVALELGRRRSIPVVYEVRGFLEDSWLSRDPRRSRKDAFYVRERARETACMLKADLVVTLGEAMRAEITSRGVPPDKVLVVANAVDEAFLRPLPDRAEARSALGVGPEEFVVGTTTSCYGFEGLDTLLAATAELRRRGIPASALIVGDGPERAALRAQAGDWARLPGRVPASQVRQYHAVFDVFAVPRRNERVCQLVTPLKPVEAMASGLPVVASDLPALAEIVEHGVTGELIPPDDSTALADRLEELFYSQSRRDDLGRSAHTRVAERTWAAAAYHYAAAYATLSPEMSDSGHRP